MVIANFTVNHFLLEKKKKIEKCDLTPIIQKCDVMFDFKCNTS